MTIQTTADVPQVRLPGQAAAHPGPIDMAMMYLMHHAFRRDLRAFSAAVPRTPLDDRESWRALAERWEVFSTALHHHHQGEDQWIWPVLTERVEPDERTTLEEMEAEHSEIDPILEACAAGLARMVSRPDADIRAALGVRLTAAKESLARHLAHEESVTIAMMQRVLTRDDWEAVEAHLSEGVGFGQVLKLVPWALHEVPAEVRDRLFDGPGGTMHRVIWLLTRRRFARHDRTAFRHVDDAS